MRLRIIEYRGNEGGGLRFVVEMLRSVTRRHPTVSLELVSHGAALRTYEGLFRENRIPCGTIEVEPGRAVDGWRYDVPLRALEGADVVWLPWVHRHRMAREHAGPVVGSFHDTIMISDPRLRDAEAARHLPANLRDEFETTREWVESDATLVVSSHATAASLNALFGVPAGRVRVVSLTGHHAGARPPVSDVPPAWEPWIDKPYLLCPANITAHKNHEGLLAGVALWGKVHPLVLTGTGTDLPLLSTSRFRRIVRRMLEPLGLKRWQADRYGLLRHLVRQLGFRHGRTLMALGYVSDAQMQLLMQRAWALVMPTFAEGGGSFPVEEALWCGIPVVCSDIPVMREHMSRVGAEVLWFNPYDPATLAAALQELHANYAAYAARARSQVASLHRRTWDDVADDYWHLFTSTSTQPPVRNPSSGSQRV